MRVNIYDAIKVTESKKYNWPFNLKFNRTINNTSTQGPGVYLVSFKEIPVYFGKFQPYNRNNIFNDRWLRHIETLTLRGDRLGFGKNSTQEKILPSMNPELAKAINNLSDAEKDQRFKDTGVCTSANKRTFAVANWDVFGKASALDILDHFDFRYYKLSNIKDADEAKLTTSELERRMINHFNFTANSSHGATNCNRIDVIEKKMYEYANDLNLKIALTLHLNTV